MKIPILRVRDKDGNYVNIPAIQGPPGVGDMEKSIYDSDGAVAAAGGIKAYVQKNGGGGDGFIQADWNQNDETAAGYIKNRPFYESETVAEIFKLENAEFVVDEERGASAYQSTNPIEIIVGNIYIVNWDGTDYTCVATDLNGVPALGNLSLMGGTGNGEPFYIGSSMAMGMFVIGDLEMNTSHTVIITSIITEIKTIDPKYIKDMYYDSTTEIVIVKEQTVTGFALTQDPIYEIENPFTINIVDGNTYIVNWDGTEYELVAATEDGITYIGNVNYVNMTSGGDIPFTIINSNASIFLATESTAESHTISVVETSYSIKQIDAKYLPIMKEGQTVFFNETIESNRLQYDYSIGLEIGKTYSVILDGVQYDNLKCYLFNATYACIGSLDNSEIPFMIGCIDANQTTEIEIMTEGESHTLSILKADFIIDEKYLPNISIPEDSISNIVKYTPQELTDEQKVQARTNIGAISQEDITGVVRYTTQALTDEQKAQARTNIGVEDAINEALSAFLFAEGQTF